MEMFLLGILTGVIIAWLAVRWLVEAAVAQVQKSLSDEEFDRVVDEMGNRLDALTAQNQPDEPEDKIAVTLERHNGLFLVYLKDNSRFLTQGTSYQQVMQNLKLDYPDRLFEIVDGDVDAIRDFMASSEQTTAA
jgi:hypothetical protein